MEGVDPQEILYDFVPVPVHLSEDPGETVPNHKRLFIEGADEWLTGMGYERRSDDLWPLWRRCPIEVLSGIFSLEEMVKLWISERIMCNVGDYILSDHYVIHKVENSHWQYGFTRDYNMLVRHLRAISRLRAPDGLEIRLTYTPRWHEFGRSIHCRNYLYLDGPFGLLFYYKGEHVLTCGFAPSCRGVLVNQVQLRKKKGNRWLFKMSESPMDMCLRVLHEAFVGDRLWLVNGTSAVDAVVRSYGKQPCNVTSEDAIRIASHYDQQLADYVRTEDEASVIGGRVLVRLEPKRRSSWHKPLTTRPAASSSTSRPMAW